MNYNGTREEYLNEVEARLHAYIAEEGTREELNTITYSSGSDLDFTLDELNNETISFSDALDAITPNIDDIEFKI